MKITRQSVISNITRTREVPVDPEDMARYNRYNLSIEEAMPYLDDADKQFILSGITPDEWSQVFEDIEN